MNMGIHNHWHGTKISRKIALEENYVLKEETLATKGVIDTNRRAYANCMLIIH